MVAAIDFDGTLVVDKWPHIGVPIPANIEYVKGLKKKGYRLILWTCRTGDSLDQAVEYCRKELGLTFDAVNTNLPDILEKYGSDNRKITADIYFDDRALNPDTLHTETQYHHLCKRR